MIVPNAYRIEVYDFPAGDFLGLASASLYREWCARLVPFVWARVEDIGWWYPADDVLGGPDSRRRVYLVEGAP